jgi:hypothetical protein
LMAVIGPHDEDCVVRIFAFEHAIKKGCQRGIVSFGGKCHPTNDVSFNRNGHEDGESDPRLLPRIL